MTSPRTGLTKRATTTNSVADTDKKKTKTAQQGADAFAKGAVTLGQTLGMTPAQKDMLRQRAYAMLNEQRLDAAEPLLEGLVVLDPFDVWVLTALGGLKLDKDAAPVALALLDRALVVSPLDVVARALRAEARAKTGDVAGALADIAGLDKADANLPAIKRVRALAAAIAAAGGVVPESPVAKPAAPTPTTTAKPTSATAKPSAPAPTRPGAPVAPAPTKRPAAPPFRPGPAPETTAARPAPGSMASQEARKSRSKLD